jgi:hypothetical protein|tara:strand:- start:404 stop:769 length:366 start_codon:yes stop_codon:yes gene_type:complete
MAKKASTTKKKLDATKSKRGRPRNANASTSGTWAIKGIENETRTKVSKAAKIAKQTIGNYVNRALVDAANETLGAPKEKTDVGLTTEQILQNLLKSQEAMNAKVEEISENQNKSILKKLFN